MSILSWLIYILVFFIVTTVAQLFYAAMIRKLHFNVRIVPIGIAVAMVTSLFWLGQHWLTLMLIALTVGTAVVHEETQKETRRLQ